METTKVNYAVRLENFALWLGIHAVSLCHFLGVLGFQSGHMTYVLCMRRKSPPHLWNGQNAILLEPSVFAGTIPNPKTYVFSKKAPFEGWPFKTMGSGGDGSCEILTV